MRWGDFAIALFFYSIGKLAIKIDAKPSWKKSMKKAKLSLAVVVSTTAIASGIVLSSVNSAEACGFYKKRFQPAMTWLNSPWSIAITLPGIAFATALYMGGRSYKNEWE